MFERGDILRPMTEQVYTEDYPSEDGDVRKSVDTAESTLERVTEMKKQAMLKGIIMHMTPRVNDPESVKLFTIPEFAPKENLPRMKMKDVVAEGDKMRASLPRGI